MNKPEIYLLTPCYNAVQTIERTIKSIAEQQGDFFVHYHVQDGGSTDGTVALLERWRKTLAQHPNCRFSFESKADKGLYDALVKGFAAQGAMPPDSFMGWINADDILLPGTLGFIANVAESLPHVEWVGGQEHVTDSNGDILLAGKVFFPQSFVAEGLCDGKHWSLLQQEGSFWKVSLWQKAGGIDPTFRLAGDWDLWRRMARHASYFVADRPLGSFSRREGQLSADVNGYGQEIDSRLAPWRRNAASIGILVQSVLRLKDFSAHYLVENGASVDVQSRNGMTWKRKVLLLLGGLGCSRVSQSYRCWKKNRM